MAIADEARDVLAAEASAVRDAIADPEARAGYDALIAAVAAGEVDDALLPPLERLLDLGLRTGRVRRLHGPIAEAAVARVFHATPKGQALAAALAEVNGALRALNGQPLGGVTVAAKGPGAYTLAIETAAATVTLEIGSEGVAVKDVSAGT